MLHEGPQEATDQKAQEFHGQTLGRMDSMWNTPQKKTAAPVFTKYDSHR